MSEPVLIPKPRKLIRRRGFCTLPASVGSELARYAIQQEIPRQISASIDAGSTEGEQSYGLTVESGSVSLIAGGRAGLFYGLMTLRQLLRQADEAGRIPCVHIEDQPHFPVRGVMLDISRDRVPTMETLKRLIDLWAEMKVNQVQLYTEHTFAYPAHGVVWKDASPITPEEAEELDRYCADRAIELVANQNSFGHMERWLKHEPYSRLAELTGSFVDPWGGIRHHPTTLNPLDPGSLELLRSLYDELLPHFTSTMINVGADEPLELGQGRSKQECRHRGIGRVYLEFLLKIHEELSRRGRIMQFYGDIILHHPKLIEELPRDIIALDWGYEADHPFSKDSGLFARAGLPFYVCPGTSSWNSLGGRWSNARKNILRAAEAGREAGAAGVLLTDWGDNGHWQQLPVSFPGWLLAAAAAWNPATAADLDIETCLSRHVFQDNTGNAARALLILGDLFDTGNARLHNAGILAVLLLPELQQYYREELKRLRGYEFSRESDQIGKASTLLQQAEIRGPDAELLQAELRFTADLMAHAARLGRERFVARGLQTDEIPASSRREMAAELEGLTDRYRELWLKRSRPGGLKDSAGRMGVLKNIYLSN